MRSTLIFIWLLSSTTLFAQLKTLPSGGNKRASVSEQVGLTDINIIYSRPGVKGREGQIWGTLVYSGYADQGFGNNRKAPWRAGANESTSISFSNDVTIEGKPLPAGKYGLFMAYDPNETTLIFSKNSTSWGSYYYDESEDALRVTVKPVPQEKSTEWLKYEFVNQTDSSATIQMVWEKLSIPFKVETDVVKNQLASFRNELRTDKGFNWVPWFQAAQWCANRGVNLEQALQWADSASSMTFGGNTQFIAHATKAQILNLLGRDTEAATVMKNAMPYATMQDIHQYGRQLIQQQKNKEALEVFKQNAAKNPKQFTTLVGLARGYSANGDYKTALRYAQQALPLAPDQLNKTNVENIIKMLKEGRDIN